MPLVCRVPLHNLLVLPGATQSGLAGQSTAFDQQTGLKVTGHSVPQG